MIRKISILLFILLLATYLIAAVTVLNKKPSETLCKDIELVIDDASHPDFITRKDVIALLKSAKLLPTDQKMSAINTRDMEAALHRHPLIDEVSCYRTVGDKIGIRLTQRIPLLRVIANNGEQYYIDHKGQTMPLSPHAAHVPVVTGFVTKTFAREYLFELGKYIDSQPLWRAQVEQINVTADRDLEVVPRVGNHVIFLGKPGNYDEKFARLKVFYTQALNQIGWNKYSRISLEFNNQIICTKKEN